MKKTVPIKENREFRRLYHRGRAQAGRLVAVYCKENRLGYNRLGITVSTKIGNAVTRNRAKRLIREAYRYYEDRLPDGMDFVVVARGRIVGADFWEVKKSFRQAAVKLRLLEAPPKTETR